MDILVLPGDGIGPEIVGATVAALDALERRYALGLALHHDAIGLGCIEKDGATLTDAVLDRARESDGTILGPVDTFVYPPLEDGGRNPSSEFRIALDLFANIRPSYARPGVPCMSPGIDLVMVRENTEGFYADRSMYKGIGEFQPDEDMALSVRKITKRASARIAKVAFELAATRRHKVTAIHKANALKLTDGLFLRTVRKVAEDYPEIELEEVIVDAMAALLIRDASRFDVIVATNMFGDILSDEAAELSGSLGLAASLNAGDDRAVAQCVHGAAPDIAGQDIANPVAMMQSTAMLLDWLGARDKKDGVREAAAAFRVAVDTVAGDPARATRDLGGKAGTKAFGVAVVDEIASAGS
ncbi:MAG: isocitrate/isopropylmalate dehydrogenase family protein [Proteobacteria bacterium]|nr:isocitrate/isopropylmalate dehydrogenase family protein [Pseudomonadota bacterium]